MQKKKVAYPIIQFRSQKEWEKWLHDEHLKTPGIWIKVAKKNSGEPTLSHDEALEIALCYGWIDGQANSLDEKFYLQKYTPRGKRSMWSKRNREIVARLTEDKRMAEAGIQAVEAAKADGRWDMAYDSPKDMVMPDDFIKRLAEDKKAEAFFQTLNKTNRYAIGWRLQTAKKPETRERRMQVILQMLREEKKFH